LLTINMAYLLGIDVGSVNAKLCLLDEARDVLRLDTEKVISSPTAALNALISRLAAEFDLKRAASVGISGSGRSVVPKELNWAEYGSPLSTAAGLLHYHPEAMTIIQIGGQSSMVMELEDGLKKPWKLVSNPLCAAGTGRFMEQQAYRLGISMDELSIQAMKCHGTVPRIAARCSVFAKTDLIHLQQKGVSIEAMLYALCESVARMVTSIKKGVFREPIYFVGGVAANKAITKALEEAISIRNGQSANVIIPENYAYLGAIGAALLSSGKKANSITVLESESSQRYFQLPPLEAASIQETHQAFKINKQCKGYLGVDVGSTSTKAVIMDETGHQVLAKHYLMTAGRPIDAVKEVFRNLLLRGADKVKIAGVGVTGSGRYLVGSLIGADLIKNEITAQTKAAAEIDSEADIIEIGGQDSKLVIKRNGIVVDYQMNKACAAGTGSFIDELADMLNVSVSNGDFAALAFQAPYTVDLGTRCAAFMGQAVASAQQEGVPLPIITASLANSIARNYLSKVVGNRRLGKKVILTGAVFYNHAVVAAFREQLKDKALTVPEHKEISGAIGTALLARESMDGEGSKFKGFQEIIDSQPSLSTFVCKRCDNNCTITRMQVLNEKPTFYGSRCDRYDSTVAAGKIETAFDERERLLFREYKEDTGTGPRVGVPRALFTYDYAPLLIGFLNALGARVVLSRSTTKETIERAAELSYSDSCFPLKLLHGHAASLSDVDYILYPCAIRLGLKEGDENQKYSCPLVQASPFIIREVLNLGQRLLIPVLDFSRGDKDVIESLAGTAAKMGFSRSRGRKAALAGIQAQSRFDRSRRLAGKKLLKQLHNSDKLGVVLFARSYLAQDSGANLGIAEKLAQLGVVPIPLDFLPLERVSPRRYSDRPYWFYESKQIAGAAISQADLQLYGLVLTNFGCGPNSFITKMVEDIMGGKPLGQLEIDEHAAEAGIVTRLEAFVDTIIGFSRSAKKSVTGLANIYRGTVPTVSSQKTILIPRMAPYVEAVGAAMEASGARVMILPEPDERNILYSNQVTTGAECLPYRVTLGDFMKYYYDGGTDARNIEGFMAGSYGPCRLGKYAIEQNRLLREIGFDLPVRSTVSNNAYRDLGLGAGFERLAWRGIVAVDCLEKLLWCSRPYEKRAGAADELFDEFLKQITGRIRKKEPFDEILRHAVVDFKAMIDSDLPRRPLVGINGEIYLRSNKFSNSNLVRACEAAGLEVVVAPMGEWIKYTSYRNLEDAVKDRKFKKMINSYIRKRIQEHDEHSVTAPVDSSMDGEELSTAELLKLTSRYLSPKCGSEAVLSIGSAIHWLEDPKYAGIISVMPHGCMPGGIVAAFAEKLSSVYQKPWISLTYDGFSETNNLVRISNFAEVIRFCSQETEARR
jgi:predicted CoA-substrate-specific enzyme activase